MLVEEKQKIASAREGVDVEAPPLVLAGVADMAAADALGDDDGDKYREGLVSCACLELRVSSAAAFGFPF